MNKPAEINLIEVVIVLNEDEQKIHVTIKLFVKPPDWILRLLSCCEIALSLSGLSLPKGNEWNQKVSNLWYR